MYNYFFGCVSASLSLRDVVAGFARTCEAFEHRWSVVHNLWTIFYLYKLCVGIRKWTLESIGEYDRLSLTASCWSLWNDHKIAKVHAVETKIILELDFYEIKNSRTCKVSTIYSKKGLVAKIVPLRFGLANCLLSIWVLSYGEFLFQLVWRRWQSYRLRLVLFL